MFRCFVASLFGPGSSSKQTSYHPDYHYRNQISAHRSILRLSSASIRSLFNFSSATQQATSYTTVTMARGSQRNGRTPRAEIPSQSSPSDIIMPVPSSIDPISQDCVGTGSQSFTLVASEPFELHTLESSALAGPENMKTNLSDSQDAQGLAFSSSSDGEKPSA